ncbi:hypothetical protein J3Q64DRAFT_1702385 [Phycomyces blakesleeanus]|uniref:ER membrane protein complex subunit 10 n=1 Tax=Phycomyces blakesleeanus TaxID=4837 RepID=A0ABR3ANM2_PHYBL
MTLSIYHIQDGDYIKRGEITDLSTTPVYTPTKHEILVKPEAKALYKLKIKDDSTGRLMMSSIPYRQLVANDWQDTFKIHLDDKGEVYHVDYYAGENACTETKTPLVGEAFKTTIQLIKPVPGPVPRLIQLNTNKPASQPSSGVNKEGTVVEIQEEQSFFRKYWYIIALGGILFLSATNPPPEEAK